MPKSRRGRKYSARSKRRQRPPVVQQRAAVAPAAAAVPKAPTTAVPAGRMALPGGVQYTIVISEIKRIAVFSAIAIAILVVLSLVLP